MPSSTYPLHQPLPPDVVARRSGGIAAYRNYPVFSWPWWWRRSLVFGIGVLLLGVPAIVSTGIGHGNWEAGMLIGLHTIVAFGAMVTVPPALATLVRHRRWRQRTERVGVVVAIVVGVVGSAFVDHWGSTFIENQLETLGVEMKMEPQVKERLRSPLVVALNLALGTTIYLALGGGLALRAYFVEQRRWAAVEQERRLTEERLHHQQTGLRLAVLQAQVEPHFLFNTLASLRSLIETDAARATAMVDALVDYLRGTIPAMRDDGSGAASTLAQQVAICESYLRLIQVRMGERLRYRIAVPDDLRDESFPPLMLISLVENAIKHGIEPKRGPGEVAIEAERVDAASLRVSVSDDGAGLAPGTGRGIGLANIRQQLSTRYGDRARLALAARPCGGAVASITLPREAPA